MSRGGHARPDLITLGDPAIRAALRERLKDRWRGCPETRIVEELGLCRGQVRVDVAVVNDLLHGYEIKSDRDRLDRLPSQAEVYGMVVDRATVVAGARQLDDVLRTVPTWWGVQQVIVADGSVCIESVRPASDNPDQVPRALVELLWREEALALLESRQAAFGVQSKPRAAVWDRICEVFDLGEIAAAVRARLRSRAGRPTLPRPA